MPTDKEYTRILDWPGYRVYQHEIDEKSKTLKLWVRRKGGNRKMECSGCGRRVTKVYDVGERAVRDLPWSGFRTTVYVEVLRLKCPDCGVKREKVLMLPSKAPFSKRLEDAVGVAYESAAARRIFQGRYSVDYGWMDWKRDATEIEKAGRRSGASSTSEACNIGCG